MTRTSTSSTDLKRLGFPGNFAKNISGSIGVLPEVCCQQNIDREPLSRKSRCFSKFFFISIFFSLSFGTKAYGTQGLLTVEGDSVHFELSGRDQWEYAIRTDGDKTILRTHKLDDVSRLKLKSWKGPLIKDITFLEAPDSKEDIVFTREKKQVQSFDYMTDQPPRLIVDFFLDGKENASSQVPLVGTVGPFDGKNTDKSQRISENTPKVNLQKKTSGQKLKFGKKMDGGGRAPAGGELINTASLNNSETPIEKLPQIMDGSDPDYQRFLVKDYEIDEKAIIRSKLNIYIRFPTLVYQEPFLTKIIETPPVYEVKAEEGDLNQKVRLLLTLFERKRYATFLKTLEMVRVDYPTSKYDELLSYLEADIQYQFWREKSSPDDFIKSMSQYYVLISQYPNSPLYERTSLLMGYSYLERGQALNVISTFDRLVRSRPDSPTRFQARIAIGQAYQSLDRNSEARATYSAIVDDPKSGEYASEAAFRLGDTYYEEKDYDKAIAEYEKARKKYPLGVKKYPNGLYNFAESCFWKAQYRQSVEAFRQFLMYFPNHPHSGYALTRVGELLEIFGVDDRRVVGAFLENIFRFKDSPGSQIARMRLMSQRMPSMKEKEIEKTRDETRQFATASDLPGIKDFWHVMVSDGYYQRGEFEKSLNLLVSFYKENTQSQNLDVFRDRIVRNLTEQVRVLVDSGSYIKAFQIFGQNSSTWLKNVQRVDLYYYVGQAYERSGVPGEAQKMYRKALNSVYMLQGTQSGKERSVFEKLPTAESLNLRLAAVLHSTENPSEASTYLSQIKNVDILNGSEKVERTELLAKISQNLGDTATAKSALASLIETWRGQPESLSKIQLELAELQMKTGELSSALTNLQKVVSLSQDLGTVPSQIFAKALELKGDVLMKSGQEPLAIETYETLLQSYEDRQPLGSVRYRLGKIFFDRGDLKKAETTWARLNKKETELWYKMAQEELTHTNWRDGYRKYLDRIPAMSGFETQKK